VGRALRVDDVRAATDRDRRRGVAYLDKVIGDLAGTPPVGRNAALNHAGWTLGRPRD
jgi:hypothetical protein